ncbi:MAG: four-helix bundle copper-binding protein [Planctomycetales bacterium]|nr:four-helix bundle copper-binding protein [Planctomycetales bacterium]
MTQTATSKDTCIQNCHECQVTCAQTLSEHCLKVGGDHTQQDHVKAMLDCIAACAACVDFMSRNSDHHALYCKACAEICKACADSCEKVGGMDKCVESCRACADTCGSMAA